jgi:hypothetical protein
MGLGIQSRYRMLWHDKLLLLALLHSPSDILDQARNKVILWKNPVGQLIRSGFSGV